MFESRPSNDEIDSLIDPEVRAEIGDPISMPDAAAVVYLPMLIVGLVLCVFWMETLPGPNFHGVRLLEDLGIGVAVGLALVAVTWFLALWLRPLQELEIEFRKVLGRLPARQILVLALLSGTAEELIFRGTLQPWIGYVAASVIFGCLHFVPSGTFIPWTLFALGAGFIFGWLFQIRESLVAPTVAHVVVNALNLLFIMKRTPPDAET